MGRFTKVMFAVLVALGLQLGISEVAAAAERDTPRLLGTQYTVPMKADTLIEKGTLVVLDAGYAAPGRAATGLIALGRAKTTVDNTDGLAGALSIDVEPGIYRWGNSASGDAIAQAEVGTQCYIVDAATVAKTSGTGTRSEAGSIVAVDSDGVWVLTRFDVSLRGVDIAAIGSALTDQGASILELSAMVARRQTRMLGPLPAPAGLHAAYDGGSGAIDDQSGPWTAIKLPGRQLQVVGSAGCATGTATITGTSEAGATQTDTLAIGAGTTTKGTKVFATVTRFATSVDPGSGQTVTLQTGPGFGLGGPVTAIHALAVDGTREAAAQSSAATGFVEPTTAPNGTRVFAVQVTP